MLSKGLFRKPKNKLEDHPGAQRPLAAAESSPARCPSCRRAGAGAELFGEASVCGACGHHLRIPARRRVRLIADEGTFLERNAGAMAGNVIGFPGYEQKLEKARGQSGEAEAVVCGTCRIGGFECAVFSMEHAFMMGSMGTVVGEKLAALFEHALERALPVVGFTVSGGARMQEGILSLMQMAKVSGAVKRHSDSGGLYIAVLTDPTTGGVTASFAMQADIILAEPGALIGFAGPRVIEQTIRQKLAKDFQRAEFLLEKGFIDGIADRRGQRECLTRLLSLHAGGASDESD